MATPPNFRAKFHAEGRVSRLSAAIFDDLRRQIVDWELPMVEEPGRLRVELWGGLVLLTRDEPSTEAQTGVVELRAGEDSLLRSMQDAMAEMLISRGAEIAWAHVAEGARAPGLALMRVESLTARGAGYVRVRISGPEATRFAAGGLHFRLLLPPQGREPVWPSIGKTGRVEWPSGEDAIHRPVYTTVAQDADWLEFDVFRHANSPTCAWIDRAPLGEAVGIVGPGGGMRPDGDPLVVFADETAIPALSRFLTLPGGEVQAYVRADPRDLGDLADDPRVRRAPDLLEALAKASPPAESGRVWLAADAETARKARKLLTDKGLAKTQFSALAYW